MKLKKMFSLALSATLIGSLLMGCGAKTTNTEPEATPPKTEDAKAPEVSEGLDPNIKATLVFALWDNVSMELYEKMDLEGRFQELYPNVDIEFEKVKDDSEYWNSMKIRASAKQLPDIMYNKTFTLANFKEYLYDLADTEAAKNNIIAEGYEIDGQILGVPEKQGHDYLYYWDDMFTQAGVEVPTTWPELLEASKKLQDYHSQSNGDFMAIAIGGKDEWPTYPFMEFMPAAESGNGQNWNSMTEVDEPFAAGTDVNKAFNKVKQLFTSGVFGKDPLGIGQDQASALFAQRQASMFVSGTWALTGIKEGADDISNLRSIYLPARDDASDPFRVVTQGDSFMSVTKHSENPELAKAFLEFYFSNAWYPEFINAIADDNTMNGVTKAIDPIFEFAKEKQPEIEYVTYDGGGENFQNLVSETKFDYKKIGAEIFIDGFDLDKKLNELNASWTLARKNLGIK